LTRRARNALGTATQSTRGKHSPPPPPPPADGWKCEIGRASVMGMVTAGVARFQGKALQRPLTAALIAGLVRGGEGVSIDGAIRA
jgi:hypothetical protein